MIDIKKSLFAGEAVCLAPIDHEGEAPVESRWTHDAEYLRLVSADPARPLSPARVKKKYEEIEMIGFVGLSEPRWIYGDAWVGIGIGERELWGKGYGTDAMRLILRYAFSELNLHRVTLGVFDYNERAIGSYEKAGFKHEGRLRKEMRRQGTRHDILIMGVLRDEWEKGSG